MKDIELLVNYEGKRVVYGIRPEHLIYSESSNFTGKENYSFTNDFIFMNSVILTEEYFDIEKIGKSSVMGFNNSNTGSANNTARWTFSIKDPNNPGAIKSYGYNDQDVPKELTVLL